MQYGMNLLRALVRGQSSEISHELRSSTGPIVTISRDFGAGADRIAQELAKALRTRCWDREILDEVVKAAGVAPEEVEHLDQHVGGWLDDWIYALSNGRHADRGLYLTHLTRVLHGIANHGGVVVGRGAYLVLAERHAFRVRITGSLELGARRIARERGISYEAARELVRAERLEREEYLRTYFREDFNDASNWDLIVNTDKIEMPKAVILIVSAMRAAGLEMPSEANNLSHATAK